MFVAEEFTFLQFPITAIREIKILKKLHHDNVIQLKEIVTSPGCPDNSILSLSLCYFFISAISSSTLRRCYFLYNLSSYVLKTLVYISRS